MTNIEMKIGVARKLDNLGRLVIPKEIRNQLRLNEYSMIEFVSCDGESLLLRKVEQNLNPSEKIDELTSQIWGIVEFLGIEECSSIERELIRIKEDIIESLVIHGCYIQ